MKSANSLISIGVFLTILLFSSAAFAETGVVTGRVVDSVSGNPLPGASVTVDGTSLSAETDRSGGFTLVRVPVGAQTLVVTYLGFEPARVDVDVVAGGRSDSIAVALTTAISEVVSVEVPILEGQARALNQQKEALNIQSIVSADQIGRFPDPNSAEAAQRIPGVTIERDQGEGRYVQVRGTESRLNSMQINGERIPSPEGDVRAVALDVIPADLLDSIEVSKALTANMDADSIGGAVNLITKRAPERTRVSLTFGLGYNDLVNDGIQNVNGTFGRRFANKKLGFLVSGSFLNTHRGSESTEPAYDEGELDEIEIRDYRVSRRRWGINTFTDYRFSDTSDINFRVIFNRFGDQEFRRLIAHKVSDGEIERELKDRFEVQNIAQVSFGGRHLLPGFLNIDYGVSYGFANEDEPDAFYSTYLQEDVEFDPNVSPNSIDPENIQANPLNEDLNELFLDGLAREKNYTSEKSFTAHFNGSIPFAISNRSAGMFKFGGKNRFNKKGRDMHVVEISIDDKDAPAFLDALDPNYTKTDYRGGLYNMGGVFQDPLLMRSLANAASAEFEQDMEEESADYDARENIFALYAMAQFHFGDKFTLVPGVRYEQTNTRYTGNRILFNEDGDFDAVAAVTGENTFRNILPSVHARYSFTPNTNFRAAYSRSLARPNYFDLVPYELILDEDLELVRGNPFLKPTTSDNFDLLVEHYFGSVGVISGGFFYKRLNNYIFPFRYREERNVGGPNGPLDTYEVTEPRNGEKADLYGLEIAYNQRFTFLPKPLDGFGIYGNYTYVASNALLPNADIDLPGRDSILPGQAKNIANFALFYERFGFSGRGSLHYRDRYLSEVGTLPAEDLFIDNHLQFDFSASQRITKNFRLFAELINLNNRPFKSYEGVANRIRQDERYSWWATFGVKLDW